MFKKRLVSGATPVQDPTGGLPGQMPVAAGQPGPTGLNANGDPAVAAPKKKRVLPWLKKKAVK